MGLSGKKKEGQVCFGKKKEESGVMITGNEVRWGALHRKKKKKSSDQKERKTPRV